MLLNENQLKRFHRHFTVDETTECWVWMKGKRRGSGFGYFNLNYKRHSAHRIAYEHWVGPIPKGMLVHHRCFNKACVNPDHLELMTPSDHVTFHRNHERR